MKFFHTHEMYEAACAPTSRDDRHAWRDEGCGTVDAGCAAPHDEAMAGIPGSAASRRAREKEQPHHLSDVRRVTPFL